MGSPEKTKSSDAGPDATGPSIGPGATLAAVLAPHAVALWVILSAYETVWSGAPALANIGTWMGVASGLTLVAQGIGLAVRRVVAVSIGMGFLLMGTAIPMMDWLAWQWFALCLLLAVGAGTLARRRLARSLLTAVALFLPVLPAIGIATRATTAPPNAVVASALAETPELPRTEERPDIWWILLDGRASAGVIAGVHGGTDALSPWLRSQGFTVVPDARSSYLKTTFSVAATLNGRHIKELVELRDTDSDDMRPLVALLREPSLVRALRGAGYRYVFHDGGYGVLRQPSADRVERPWPYIDELGGRIYARTTAARLLNLVLPRGGLMASRRRHHLRTTLASIRAEEPSAAPALHFVHLVAPHPPFVFNADGSDRPVSDPGGIDDDYEWRHRHRPADETYSAGYVAHSAWLDQALQEPLDRLMAGRPAVIVVQGDHGSRSIHLDLDNPDPDALRERVNILYAIRMHDGRQLELPAQATPVNTLRLVLAEVFGAATPPVDDRTFLQDWHRPYQFR